MELVVRNSRRSDDGKKKVLKKKIIAGRTTVRTNVPFIAEGGASGNIEIFASCVVGDSRGEDYLVNEQDSIVNQVEHGDRISIYIERKKK